MLLGPHRQSKSSTFPFTENMDKRGFGYDGFSDKITTHGWSHLSLLRNLTKKKGSKRKITAINLKGSFTAGFCLFFFFWFLSFLLFLASVLSAFYQISLEGNYFSTCFVIFFFFVLHPYQVFVLCFSIFTLLYVPLTSFFLPLISFHVPLTSNYQESCHAYLSSLLGPQWILGWILGFLLLYIYLF